MHIVDGGIRQLIDARAAASLVFLWISGSVFWAHFVGAVLLAIGLPIVITKELPRARGLDRIVVFGRLFWSFPSEAVLLVAGACLLIKKKTRWAATCLGVTILVLVLAVYLPILAAEPSAIGTGLNYFVDTLAFGGAVLVLAGALPKEDDSHV